HPTIHSEPSASFYTHPAPTALSTLSLHDALPIYQGNPPGAFGFDQPLQRGHVNIAFEIEPGLRVGGLRNGQVDGARAGELEGNIDRKSTRLNSSHVAISYAVFCLKKKKDVTELGG